MAFGYSLDIQFGYGFLEYSTQHKLYEYLFTLFAQLDLEAIRYGIVYNKADWDKGEEV